MIIEGDKCLLWSKGKAIADKKGLDMAPKCPLVEQCTGERCAWLGEGQTVRDQLSVFYERLDKGQTKMRLSKLRAELKSLTPEDYYPYEL